MHVEVLGKRELFGLPVPASKKVRQVIDCEAGEVVELSTIMDGGDISATYVRFSARGFRIFSEDGGFTRDRTVIRPYTHLESYHETRGRFRITP